MNIDDYKAIGKRVQWARLDKKMTQDYVAEQLGVGCQHISNIERGIIGISFETFYSLAKLLNCGADYLMFRCTDRRICYGFIGRQCKYIFTKYKKRY